MTASLSPIVKQQFFDDSGNPLAGGKLYTYIAGSNTTVATYKTAAGNDENTNPIILNARGECDIWLSSSIAYKFKLCDSDNAEIWTVDNITVGGTGGSGGTVDWSSITNRPTTYPPSPHTQNWTTILNTPTTLGGYGITDAYTKAEMDYYLGQLFQRVINLEYFTEGHEIRITSLESSVSAINNDITNLQNTDISLQSQIDGNTSAINQLQTDLNDVYDDINLINTNINTLSGDVTSLLESQYKVKVTSADTAADYLFNKIGTNNDALTIANSSDSIVTIDYDGRVPSDSGDTETSAWGTLYDKLLPGANMTMDLVTCAGIRKVQFNAITSGIEPIVGDHKVMASLTDPSYGTLEEKLIDFEGNSFSVVTCGGVQKVQITSDTYKTKITSATEAGFLNDVLDVNGGISKTIDGNKIVLTAEGSAQVSVNSADTNPGYLADKIKGSDNISITTSANQVLIVSATGEFDTYKVKTDANDTADYLPNKLIGAGAVDIQTIALGPSEKKTMIIGTGKVAITSADTSPDFLNNKLVAGDGISITTSGDVMTVASNFSLGSGFIADGFSYKHGPGEGYLDFVERFPNDAYITATEIVSGFPSGLIQFNVSTPIIFNQSVTTPGVSAFRGYSPNAYYANSNEQAPLIYTNWADPGFGGTSNSRYTFNKAGKWQINWGAQMFSPAGSYGSVNAIVRHYSSTGTLKNKFDAIEACGFWTTSGFSNPIQQGSARRSEVINAALGDYIELRLAIAGQGYGSTGGATSAYQIDYSGHLIENAASTISTRTASITVERYSSGGFRLEDNTVETHSNDGIETLVYSSIFNNKEGNYYKIKYVLSDNAVAGISKISVASLVGAKGDKGDKGDPGGGGVSDGKVKVTSAGTADYLANKIEAAAGSPLYVNVVDDILVLDVIESGISDPLIQTVGLMNENGVFGATGNCYSDVWEDGEWGTGWGQNTSDAYYRVSVVGRGTISKVRFFINSLNDIDAGVSGTGNFGAIRIGLFNLDGTLKGQTAWVRGLSAVGTTTLDMTPISGQNLTIERNTEYWIGFVARGMQMISYNKDGSGFNPDNNALRYSLSIRSSSNGANWSPNFWNTSGGGFIQNKVPVILMSSTE